MMRKLFSTVYRDPTAFYFHSSSDKADGDCLGYLRTYDDAGHFFEAWPYDMPSYFRFVQIHKSINTNGTLPLLEEREPDSAITVWSIPLPVFNWIRSYSLEEITDQWIRFFSTWAYDKKEDIAFQQSPEFLHERIESGFAEFREKVMPFYRLEDDDALDAAMNDFLGDNPAWLQDGNSGNVPGVCKNWTFPSCQFYARNEDIEWCKRNRVNLVRSESDRDAFWFWKAFKNTGRWITNENQTQTKKGFVYLITDGELFKIGYSANHPSTRLAQCQTGNPNSLSLVGFVNGDLETEKELHRRFAANRVRGEWFSLSATDVKSILKS